MTTLDHVEIRPEVAMYAAFARLNYKPWYALAEFLDNSLQSFLSNRVALVALHGNLPQLRIFIEFSEKCIVIRDNAAGISKSDFPRAFLPASPPPDTTGLSEFGLGMKAAACWFSRHWSVRTSALGEAFESTVTYDIPAITSQHLERLPVVEAKVDPNEHYTILTLESLNVKPKASTVTKIKRHLASIYRKFIENGTLKLSFDGEPLTYEPAVFLRASRFDNVRSAPIEWRKDFSLVLDENHRIWGWAGLLGRASVANAGFSVFRRNRLIEGSYGEAYRPDRIFRKSNSYTFQRLVGELNVEGFTVSHTKDGVQWEEWEDDLLEWLKRELDLEPVPLLRQAENYRSRPDNVSNAPEHAASDTERLLTQHVPPLFDAQLHRTPEDRDLPAQLPSAQPVARRDVRIMLTHARQRWHVEVDLISEDGHYEWLEIAKDEHRADEHHLQIQVNIAHPFMVRFTSPGGTELTAFVRMAAALAISEVTARATGVRQAGTIRRNLNQLLHDALAGPVDFDDSSEG